LNLGECSKISWREIPVLTTGIGRLKSPLEKGGFWGILGAYKIPPAPPLEKGGKYLPFDGHFDIPLVRVLLMFFKILVPPTPPGGREKKALEILIILSS
jgi:hypothetical protein